jgi:hypothetical protein
MCAPAALSTYLPSHHQPPPSGACGTPPPGPCGPPRGPTPPPPPQKRAPPPSSGGAFLSARRRPLFRTKYPFVLPSFGPNRLSWGLVVSSASCCSSKMIRSCWEGVGGLNTYCSNVFLESDLKDAGRELLQSKTRTVQYKHLMDHAFASTLCSLLNKQGQITRQKWWFG